VDWLHSGRVTDKEHITKLKRAGFTDSVIEEVKVYTDTDVFRLIFCGPIVIEELAKGEGGCCKPSGGMFSKDVVSAMAGNVMSAFVRASK
jgi:hypothetical protein